MTERRRSWRILVLIGTICAVVCLGIWAWPEVQRQQRYLRTAGTLITSGIAASVWFLFWAPLRRRTRISVLLAGAALLITAAFSFRIRGVTGDLVPILEPRWQRSRQTSAKVDTLAKAASVTISSNMLHVSFPQLYGPHRNGVLGAPILETNWKAHPPQILWKRPIGPAWSGFSIEGNKAITLEQSGAEELVVAYELLSGQPIWSHSDTARYATTIAGEGPRSTPTISSNRVFTFGATGILNCLDLETGKRIWSHDARAENEAGVPEWGFASSPLIIDDKVVVSVGGSKGRSLVAYRISDGEFVWGAGHRGAGYSSPIEASLFSERQILYFSTDALVSFSPEGKPLWEFPWPAGQPKVSLPVVIGQNSVLISSGYGAGCALLQIRRSFPAYWEPTGIWKTLSLKSKFGPIFVLGGFIYGLDDGIFTCVDVETGKRKWKDGRYGHGQGLLVGDIILLTSESGEVVLIRPSPEDLTELGRFQVFNDKTWNPPALAGEYLLMRNDKEAACIRLRTRASVTKM